MELPEGKRRCNMGGQKLPKSQVENEELIHIVETLHSVLDNFLLNHWWW
jgi:hypothetical protein